MTIAFASILFLLIVIIGIFVIYGVKSAQDGKKDAASPNFFIASGVSLVMSSFGTIQSLIKELYILVRYSQNVDDSIRISNEIGRPDIVQLIIGLAFVCLGIYFLHYNKHRIYILNLNGYFSNRVEDRFRDLNLARFEFKEREVNFINNKTEMTATKSDDIVNFIERNVTSFREQSHGFKVGYTGIAHIPFVAIAGTYLKRMSIDEYYEFDKKTIEKFTKLEKHKRKVPQLAKVDGYEGSFENNPDSAVIAVSTTAPITESQLSQFKDCGIVFLSIKEPKDNSIVSQNQLLDYRNIVINTIEKLQQKHPYLKRVHLLCATQSCLVLEIGKSIGDYRNIQVVVYHFDAQAEPNYPWGLVINGRDQGAFIKA